MNNFLDKKKIISEIVGIIERKLHIVLHLEKKKVVHAKERKNNKQLNNTNYISTYESSANWADT